jgi:hypothetical protein
MKRGEYIMNEKVMRWFRNVMFNIKNRMVIRYIESKYDIETQEYCIDIMKQIRDYLIGELKNENDEILTDEEVYILTRYMHSYKGGKTTGIISKETNIDVNKLILIDKDDSFFNYLNDKKNMSRMSSFADKKR